MNQRLRTLLGDERGQIRPHLQALHQALSETDRPATVASWLNKSAAPAILEELQARNELTHQALDDLPARKPVEHLRSVLLAIGTLQSRDEHFARLERWLTDLVAGRPDPDEQQLLHRNTIWHLLRRLRLRTSRTETTHSQATVVQQRVRAAISLLDWLTHRRLIARLSKENQALYEQLARQLGAARAAAVTAPF